MNPVLSIHNYKKDRSDSLDKPKSTKKSKNKSKRRERSVSSSSAESSSSSSSVQEKSKQKNMKSKVKSKPKKQKEEMEEEKTNYQTSSYLFNPQVNKNNSLLLQSTWASGLDKFKLSENRLSSSKTNPMVVSPVQPHIINTNNRVKILQSRLEMELPMPKIPNRPSGTLNNAFGNVREFLDFIMKRSTGDENFYWRLKNLRKEEPFDGVIFSVIRSIRAAVEAKQQAIQSQILPGLEKINGILTEMDKAPTLKVFLELVLKAYTIESFLYSWLNQLLRNENWAEINVLTPYLICLLYVFTHKKYIIPYSTQKLILYRGTALTEQHLRCYHDTKMFSWNAMTSTSRNKNEALKFACSSGNKMGILFIIEANFKSFEDGEGIIDVRQYSAFPSEEEVIFAPGSVFEVTGISPNQNQNQSDSKYKYEVRLKFRKNFEKSDKTLANLQYHVIINPPPGGYTNPASMYESKKAVIKNLKPEEIRNTLNLLQGDQSCKTLSIEGCVLDNSLIKLLHNVIKTTKLQEIKVVNNHIIIDSFELLSDFNSKHREQILAENKVTIQQNYY